MPIVWTIKVYLLLNCTSLNVVHCVADSSSCFHFSSFLLFYTYISPTSFVLFGSCDLLDHMTPVITHTHTVIWIETPRPMLCPAPTRNVIRVDVLIALFNCFIIPPYPFSPYTELLLLLLFSRTCSVHVVLPLVFFSFFLSTYTLKKYVM